MNILKFEAKTICPLFILLFIAFSTISAQKAMQINHSCNFATDEKEGILYTYDASKEATQIIEKIMKANVLPQNFIIKAADCKNALATTEGKERYILYSTTFLESFKKDAQTAWAAYCVLAHEIGHHLSNHNLEETDISKRKVFELEADKFAGAALYKLGANLLEAQAGIKTFALEGDTKTHPSARTRLEAIAVGWKQAKEFEENKEAMKGELRLVSASDKLKAREIVAATKIPPSEGNVWTHQYLREQYNKALYLDPNYAEAYCALATVTKEREDALNLLDKAIALNPSFAEAYYEKALKIGSILWGKDLIREMIQTLDTAIQLNPNFINAYLARSMRHDKLKNYKQALNDISKAIALEKDEKTVYKYYNDRGDIYKKLNRNEEAIADYAQYDKLLKKYDPNAAEYNIESQVCNFIEMKRFDKAFEITQLYLEKKLKESKNWAYNDNDIRRNLTCYYNYFDESSDKEAENYKTTISERWFQKATQEADTLAAIKFLQEAIRTKPTLKAHLLVGNLIIAFEKQASLTREAYEDHFKKILDIQPDHLEALYGAKWVLRHAYHQNLQWMLLEFDKQIDVFRDMAAYFTARGYVTIAGDGFAESLVNFDKALALNPKLDTAWSGKSLAHYQLGYYKDAIDCANKALALNPKAKTPKKLAETALRQVATADKKAMATLYFEKGLKSENNLTRIAFYKLAIEYKPDFAEAYFNLAEKYEAMNKDSLAMACYNKVIDIQPQNFGAYQKRIKLQNDNNVSDETIVKQLEVAAQKSPIAAELYVLKGIQQQDKDAEKDALESFDKAILKNPKLEMAYTAKGCFLVKIKRYNDAVEPLNQAVKLNPKNENAKDCRKEALKRM